MSDEVSLDELVRRFVSRDLQPFDKINLSEGTLEYKSEDAASRASRLKREEDDASMERRLRFIISLTALGVVIVIIGVCSYVLLAGYTLDEKRLVVPVLTAAAGVLFGYVFGRSQSR